MKRFACLCGGLAVLVAAQSAKAVPVVTTNAGLTVWYDVRPTINEITVAPVTPFTIGTSTAAVLSKKESVLGLAAGNDGGPGDAQILWVSPRLPIGALPGSGHGGHVTGNAKKGFVDNSVKNLYAFITVEPNGAGTEQVISALGRDTDVLKGGTAGLGNPIEDILVTPDTANWSVGGTTASAAPAGDDWALSAKSVKIPVVAGPLYDATGGAIPTGVYRVACIRVTAGTWNKGTGTATAIESTYNGFDQVNNLLMTRAVKTGGPAPAELPDFGYTTDLAALPEATTGNGPEVGTGDGLTIGTTSASPDFQIIVQMKGDFNNDGNVTAADILFRNNAVLAGAAIRQRELYLCDLDNGGTCTASDVPPFNSMAVEAATVDGDCTTFPLVDCLPSGLPAPACPAP
jgi:hypothetical protein